MQVQLPAPLLVAIRTREWKYIQTLAADRASEVVFEELYNLRDDPGEMSNLARKSKYRNRQDNSKEELTRLRSSVA